MLQTVKVFLADSDSLQVSVEVNFTEQDGFMDV